MCTQTLQSDGRPLEHWWQRHLLNGTIYTQNSRFGLTTDAEDYALTADDEFDLLVGGAVLLDSNVVVLRGQHWLGRQPRFGGGLGGLVRLGRLDRGCFGDELGGIRWEENATQYTLSDTEFSFRGLTREFIDNPDSTKAVLNTVVDSLTTVFSLDETPTSFRTPTSAAS